MLAYVAVPTALLVASMRGWQHLIGPQQLFIAVALVLPAVSAVALIAALVVRRLLPERSGNSGWYRGRALQPLLVVVDERAEMGRRRRRRLGVKPFDERSRP
jgi:hypothetical protein